MDSQGPSSSTGWAGLKLGQGEPGRLLMRGHSGTATGAELNPDVPAPSPVPSLCHHPHQEPVLRREGGQETRGKAGDWGLGLLER